MIGLFVNKEITINYYAYYHYPLRHVARAKLNGCQLNHAAREQTFSAAMPDGVKISGREGSAGAGHI